MAHVAAGQQLAKPLRRWAASPSHGRNNLTVLRSATDSGRVAKAISLAGVTRVTLAKSLGMSHNYVCDAVRGRYRTITVENAAKFAPLFGCYIKDLFPVYSGARARPPRVPGGRPGA